MMESSSNTNINDMDNINIRDVENSLDSALINNISKKNKKIESKLYFYKFATFFLSFVVIVLSFFIVFLLIRIK